MPNSELKKQAAIAYATKSKKLYDAGDKDFIKINIRGSKGLTLYLHKNLLWKDVVTHVCQPQGEERNYDDERWEINKSWFNWANLNTLGINLNTVTLEGLGRHKGTKDYILIV